MRSAAVCVCLCRLLPASFCLSFVRAGRVCCPRFFQGAISSFHAIIFRFSPRTHTHTDTHTTVAAWQVCGFWNWSIDAPFVAAAAASATCCCCWLPVLKVGHSHNSSPAARPGQNAIADIYRVCNISRHRWILLWTCTSFQSPVYSYLVTGLTVFCIELLIECANKSGVIELIIINVGN